MARIKLFYPCEFAAGKVADGALVSYRHRKQSTFTYTWKATTRIASTPARMRQRQLMKQATIAASEIMHDPLQRELWYKRFTEQQQYENFYPFLIASQMKLIKSQSDSPQKEK